MGSTLYGTTNYWGSGSPGSKWGTFYKVNTDGTGFSVIQHLDSITTGGISYSRPISVGTNVYGVNAWGGSDNGNGTVYKYDTLTQTYSLVHVFDDYAYGAGADGGLMYHNGYLYGATYEGGASDLGTIFRINEATYQHEVLHDFTDAAAEGSMVNNRLCVSGDMLYGYTGRGGQNGKGTIFKLSLDGASFSTIYNFESGTQVYYSELTAVEDRLYGDIQSSSDNVGYLFSIATDGSGFTVLKEFPYDDRTQGAYPTGGMLYYDGKLYGHTYGGGATANQAGVLYAYTLDVPPSPGAPVWKGGGVTNDMGNGDNWTTGTPEPGADVTFGTGGSAAMVDALRTVGQVVFDRAADFVLGGTAALTVNGGIVKEGASNYTLSCPVVLGANQSWNSDNAAGILAVSGSVNLGANSLEIGGVGTTNVSGAVSGAGGLTKTGAGTLTLSGDNDYTGTTTVAAGTLGLQGGGALSATAALAVNGGAVRLDNASAANNNDRLNDGAAIALNGGALLLDGSAAENTSETVGAITLGGGASTISVTHGSGHTAALTAASLARNGSATVNFTTADTADLGADVKIMFNTRPNTADGDILTYATVNGTDFATYYLLDGVKKFTAYTEVSAPGDWASVTGDSNVKITGDVAIPDNVTVNTLVVTGSAVSGTTPLTVSGGGLIVSGTSSVTVPEISFSSGAGSITTSGPTTITSAIADASALTISASDDVTISGAITNVPELVKSGSGLLVMTETSSYAGSTTVNEGELKVYGTIGDALITDGGKLSGTGSIGDVTVQGGGIYSPGSSPGQETYASLVWGANGSYDWEINATEDAGGMAGPDPDLGQTEGWDLTVVTGLLTVADHFIVNIISEDLEQSNDPGDAAGFLSASDYMWTIATAGSISGFDPDKITLVDNFTNPGATLDKFFIGQVDNTIMLAYSASGEDPFGGGEGGEVPEPSTLFLLLPLVIGFGLNKMRAKGRKA